MMKRLSIISAFVLTSALLLPAATMAEDTHSAPIEKLISEIADKPDQHQAIATYYRNKIAEANEDLAMHIKMRQAYEIVNGKKSDQADLVSMLNHCDELISHTKSNIKIFEAMAAEHQAKAMKKP